MSCWWSSPLVAMTTLNSSQHSWSQCTIDPTLGSSRSGRCVCSTRVGVDVVYRERALYTHYSVDLTSLCNSEWLLCLRDLYIECHWITLCVELVRCPTWQTLTLIVKVVMASWLLSLHTQYQPPVVGRSGCGFVGLRNAGATCYMNSVLQQLYMTQKIREVCC